MHNTESLHKASEEIYYNRPLTEREFLVGQTARAGAFGPACKKLYSRIIC